MDGNAKTDLDLYLYPEDDENYARGSCSCFRSVYTKYVKSSHKRDAEQIPSRYDNDDIQEFAKIFTGLADDDGQSRDQNSVVIM